MATTAPPLHGLSRDVTLAVLPRLYIEELVAEISRRNISFGGYSFTQETLVGVLKEVMMQEYSNLEPDDVADDRKVEFTPDTELAEREQFQGQVLQEYSETLSMICPTTEIEYRPTQCHDGKDSVAKQENQTVYEGSCLENYPGAETPCDSSMISVSANEEQTPVMESASDCTETVTSATTGPTLQLGNICSPKTELEDDNARNDEELRPDDTVFQRRNSSSGLSKNSRCSKPSNMKFYSCKDCTYRTKHRSIFTRHTKIHTGEKPFMCTYCDYRAARRDVLQSHMFCHSVEKPYKCSECDFKAAQKRHLVQHMRKHTGEKPYLCNVCGYQTAHMTNIRRHMKTHTGDKPYVCDVCGYRTTRNAYLVAHQRKLHERETVCGDDYKSAKNTTF